MHSSIIWLASFIEVQNGNGKIFQIVQNQAIRIPKDFEFKGGNDVAMRKEDDRIIIETVRKKQVVVCRITKGRYRIFD